MELQPLHVEPQHHPAQGYRVRMHKRYALGGELCAPLCVRTCVCACVRACVRVCMRTRRRAVCVRAHVHDMCL